MILGMLDTNGYLKLENVQFTMHTLLAHRASG